MDEFPPVNHSRNEEEASSSIPEEKPAESAAPEPAPEAAAPEPPEEAKPGPEILEPGLIEEPVVEKKERTPLQRFLRNLLVWAIIAVVFFTAGAVVFYFVRYQPLQVKAQQSVDELASIRETQTSTEGQLKSAQDKATGLQTQYDQAKADLDKAAGRAALQMALAEVTNARLALVNKDGPSARTALMAAQADLAKLAPVLQQKDANLAKDLDSRLSLALNELSRDPNTAKSDLEILTRSLQDLDKAMFQ